MKFKPETSPEFRTARARLAAFNANHPGADDTHLRKELEQVTRDYQISALAEQVGRLSDEDRQQFDLLLTR